MSADFVVCDGCGFYYGKTDAPLDCIHCGSQAKWAFPEEEEALAYSAQVRERRQAAHSQERRDA